MHEKALLMSSRTGLWLPLIIWMALIFLFSTDLFSSEGTGGMILPVLAFLFGWLLPDESLYSMHSLIRKSAHFTEYGILGILWYRALNPTLSNWRLKPAVWAFLLSSVYAVTDEFHQTFTATRGGSARDVLIDSSGVLSAIIAVWFYSKVSEVMRGDEHK